MVKNNTNSKAKTVAIIAIPLVIAVPIIAAAIYLFTPIVNECASPCEGDRRSMGACPTVCVRKETNRWRQLTGQGWK